MACLQYSPVRHPAAENKKVVVNDTKRLQIFADKEIIITFVLLLRRVSSAG